MSSRPEVVVYGASGYTGKIICWHLAERGIPFIAAGRNKKRLEEQMAKLPALADAEYECVAVDLERKALAKLFEGTRVVYNIVGPFMQLSEPVVQACLDAGVHYLDTTGEQDWIMKLQEEYGSKFKKKGLLLCPAHAWMWWGGEMAAELALETPGIDQLDIIYMADSYTSVASTKSFLRMCCRDQYYLADNKLEVWPHTEAYDVTVPGDHRIYKSLPWSGAGEPVWYLDDDRVRHCQVKTVFRRQEVVLWVIERINEWYNNLRDLPREEQEKHTNEWGAGMVSEEPPLEVPELNRSVVSCHGRGNTGAVQVVLRGNSPYIQVGVVGAECVYRLLSGRHRAEGFASPCKAFGHREMMAVAAERGYLNWEVKSQ